MNTRGSGASGRGPRGADAGSTDDQVFRITTASDSLQQDQAKRTKKYLIQMAIRIVCIAAACVVHGPLVWVFIIGAAILPYVAVVGANAGRERNDQGMELMDYRALGAGTPENGIPAPDPAADSSAKGPHD